VADLPEPERQTWQACWQEGAGGCAARSRHDNRSSLESAPQTRRTFPATARFDRDERVVWNCTTWERKGSPAGGMRPPSRLPVFTAADEPYHLPCAHPPARASGQGVGQLRVRRADGRLSVFASCARRRAAPGRGLAGLRRGDRAPRRPGRLLQTPVRRPEPARERPGALPGRRRSPCADGGGGRVRVGAVLTRPVTLRAFGATPGRSSPAWLDLHRFRVRRPADPGRGWR
jgi:hypothetical protein